jgi:hypothetical protein
MNRKFGALLAFLALAIGLGGIACLKTDEDLDRADETDGAT